MTDASRTNWGGKRAGAGRPGQRRISFYPADVMLAQLDEIALAEGVSRAVVVHDAILAYVEAWQGRRGATPILPNGS